MNQVLWAFLIFWFVLSALIPIILIGRPRKPVQPGDAALAALINIIIMLCVLLFGGVL